MHVIVVGAGIIGVCTAYFLRRAGMDVTVVERRPPKMIALIGTPAGSSASRE